MEELAYNDASVWNNYHELVLQSKGELSWLGIQLKVRDKGNPAMEGKGSLVVADQSLALHRTLIKDRDNLAVADQNLIQGMVLRRIPMGHHLPRILTPHHLPNMVPLLISRAVTDTAMRHRSKHHAQ
jgi:hypothetical protein